MSNYLKLIYALITLTFLISSCSSIMGTVNFTPQEDFILTNYGLREYIQNTESPRVVLKVPQGNSLVVEDLDLYNASLYYAIEKEFLDAGFEVRDRQLFDIVLTKLGTDKYYEDIRDATNTDLLIELVSINDDVKYTTNKYTTKSGREITTSTSVTYYGASVEFRVTLIGSNNISGIYSFNYAPCQNGCSYYGLGMNKKSRQAILDKIEKEDYEFVERDAMVEFVSLCAKELIFDMGR